jgi:hypothetical protein
LLSYAAKQMVSNCPEISTDDNIEKTAEMFEDVK